MRFDDDGSLAGGAGLGESLDGVLAVLRRQAGFRWGCVGRSPDTPGQWVVVTVWRDVGTMRRGIGSYEAKVALGPVQALSGSGSGAYEVLAERDAESMTPRTGTSDRAAGADTARLGE